MPIVADASAAVRADLSPFKRDLQGLNKPVKSFGDKLGAVFSPKGLLLGAGGAIAMDRIVNFFGDAIGAASDLNETITKTGQIFGDQAMPRLEAWAETASTSFGQSKQQALDAASSFAIFGKSAGLTGDQLVGFGENLTTLASDFASFYNTDPQDAIVAIQAALRGEQEPIRKYGVLLDDATLRQRALKLGIVKTTKDALTPQQRVLAAQAEIFAQTSDAQGDFARTSTGLANTQRTNAAKMADAMAKLGDVLLPLATQLAGFAGDVLPGLVDQLRQLLEVGKGLGDIAGSVGGFFDTIDKAFTTSHDTILDQLSIDIDPQSWAEALHQFVVTTTRELTNFDGVMATALSKEGAVQHAQDYVAGLEFSLEHGTPAVASAAGDVAGTIPAAVKGAKESAKDIAASLPSDIASAILAGKKDLKPIRKMIRDILAGSVSDGVALGQNAAALMNPGIADALRGNSKEAKDAMLNEVVEPLIESILTLEPTALDAGAKVPKNIKQALDQNGPLAVQAMRDLMGDQNATLGQLAVFARARGLEGIAALIDAMRSKRADAAAAGRDVAASASSGLDFSPKARAVGAAVINSYIDAMESTIDRRVFGFENKVDDLLRILTMAGSPPYTHSKEAGKGVAASYLDALSKGLTGGLGDVSGMLNASLLPSWASPVAGVAAPASSNTYNVNTGSVPKEKTTLEIAYELRRAEYLDVLPQGRGS